jgi:hypothetical protein
MMAFYRESDISKAPLREGFHHSGHRVRDPLAEEEPDGEAIEETG